MHALSRILTKASASKLAVLSKNVHMSRVLFGVKEDFLAAQEKMGSLTEEPDNMTKLKIYALFKQASEGKCTKKKPGVMDFVGQAKWKAWTELGDMSQEDAQKTYAEVINNLAGSEAAVTPTSVESENAGKYQTLNISRDGKLYGIMLNRPNKKNAITLTMYEEWIVSLKEAAEDNSVTLASVTGAGDYFCSGNDLSNFTNIPDGMSLEEMSANARDVLFRFVNAFIDFPKPLVGLVNGPAVGVSVSTLALYDYVIAADNSTFHMPFSALGQTPEGCSSYTFPKIMGTSQANAMLMFNRKIDAKEALKLGLISEILPAADFANKGTERAAELSKLPPQTLQFAKQLIRAQEVEALRKANTAECNRLQERWLSDECREAIMAFFARKN